MPYFCIAIAILLILGGLTLKYAYLACKEAEKLYKKEMNNVGFNYDFCI